MSVKQSYISRAIAASIAEALTWSRIVTVCGARQVGKSTLVRELEQGKRAYYTLDDPETLDAALHDPSGFAKGLTLPATIDEIQRAPSLLLPIKIAADTSREPGRFLLTGSANLLSLPKIADSLAGRVQIFELQSLAQSEIEGSSANIIDALFSAQRHWVSKATPATEIADRIVRGGYPETLSLTPHQRTRWFENYVQTLMQRDILDIARIEHSVEMRRLLRIIAARTGRILNASALSSDIELPPRTILRYLDILDLAFLTFRISGWAGDRARRHIRSPKAFLTDTGLAAALTGLDATALLKDRNHIGGLLESFVVGEIRRQASWSEQRATLYHYRTNNGSEVDLLLETSDERRIGIEIKASASVGHNEVRTLLQAADEGFIERGIVFSTGETVVPLRENVHIVPVANLWA